ncbi:hypothetical protein [Streptantibioticus silvisoli]|uniref:Tat pathway signal sequence domain protein n=1 Tax=Streptantibioticus silvisoli TaxID=2705255 RepID=A0ABT6W6R5_9ACTN|nr:hypothetical protein [Streptantibioticus silvisoli]MDI5966440.1 hypothetical protein [Streptantibioticus silvisoli]
MTAPRIEVAMRRTLLGGTAAAAALAALGVAAAPAAVAAPAVPRHLAGHTSTFTVPAGRRSVTDTAGGASVTVVPSSQTSPRTTITCNLVVANPTLSDDTVDGTVLVYGAVLVYCDGTVARIQISLGLYLNGSLVDSATRSVIDTDSSSWSLLTPYQSGDWQTGGLTDITWATGGTGSIPENYSAVVPL